MEESKKTSRANKEDALKETLDFESRLSSVMEQDGVVMSTPSGVKKRAPIPKKARKKQALFFGRPMASGAEDAAEKMDLENIACIVKRHEAPTVQEVKIRHRPHARSAFVVSLRDCFMPEEGKPEERVPLAQQIAHNQSLITHHGGTDHHALTSATLKAKSSPLDSRGQYTSEHTSPSVLTLKLLAKRCGLVWNELRGKSAKTYSAIRKKEQAVVHKAGLELTEAAEEMATRRFSYPKAAIGFLALVVIITLPAQALTMYRRMTQERAGVELEGQKAVDSLAGLAGGSSLSFSPDQLQNASGRFKEADRLLDESRLLAVTAAALVPKQYRSARSLLEVGDKMSQAGQLLALGFAKVFDDPSRSLIERLEVLGAYARGASPLLTQAEQAAQKIDFSSIPADQQAKAKELPEKIRLAKESVREFAVLSDALVGFLGKDRQRNYLLVFQNQTELRPSGGFMGSIAEVRMDRGKIASIYVPKGGTYDLKGELVARVRSPKPIQLVNALWQFQDANWFADFPKTAEKLRWFWSKSGQPTLDGMVAVNASFMEKILKITGPVDMPEYGKVITADNFLMETQKAVELEYDKQANTPKKFIGDLFEKMMQQAKGLTPQQWLALAATCSQSLETKEIQVAMYDPQEEALVEGFGWQGRLKPTSGDSLAVIGANIAGQKTDLVVKESVDHQAEIQDDGSIIDTLRLHREHQGQKGEPFRGVRNVQYLRVYVPKGSEILDARGFTPPPPSLFKQPLETDGNDPDLEAIEKSAKPAMNTVWTAVEDDRTVFGGWLQLDPGKSQDIVLKYRLPFTVYNIMDKVEETAPQSADSRQRGAYLMLFTSQSGKDRQLTHEVKLAANWKSVWVRSPSDSSATEGQVKAAAQSELAWQGTWDRDQAMAVLLSADENGHDQEKR